MKHLTLALGLIFSIHSFAADTTLICNDQNSHGVYQLTLSENLSTAQLTTLVSDSSTLSAGTKILKIEEGESSEEYSTYGGKSNLNLEVALLLNARKASTLQAYEILEIVAYYQKAKGGFLTNNTLLLCSQR